MNSNIKWSYKFHKCPYCEETSIIKEPWLTNHITEEHPVKLEEWKLKKEAEE